MRLIVHSLISFCVKKAYRYDKCKAMLVAQNASLTYVYATGLMVHKRDKWLKRVSWLLKRIDR